MARIAGVDIPNNKRIEIALTYIYGIGLKSAQDILAKTGIDPNTRAKDLTEAEVAPENMLPVQEILLHNGFIITHGLTALQNQINVTALALDGGQGQQLNKNKAHGGNDQEDHDHQQQSLDNIF